MSLEEIITTRNSMIIARALAKQAEPISLRQLARVSQLPVSSTELIIKKFLALKIISLKRIKNKTTYFFDHSLTVVKSLLQIIKILEEQPQGDLLKKLSRRAQASLKFIEETSSLANSGRQTLKNRPPPL